MIVPWRRLAALVAVFAVVFAPGATAAGASTTVDQAVMDLSAAVLAPTFSAANASPRRVEADHDDRSDNPGADLHAWIASAGKTAGAWWTITADEVARDPRIEAQAQAWSRRGPPRN